MRKRGEPELKCHWAQPAQTACRSTRVRFANGNNPCCTKPLRTGGAIRTTAGRRISPGDASGKDLSGSRRPEPAGLAGRRSARGSRPSGARAARKSQSLFVATGFLLRTVTIARPRGRFQRDSILRSESDPQNGVSARVQICDQRVQIFIMNHRAEGRHHASAFGDRLTHLRVGCWRAAGESRFLK
jgi:hypothetical protein